MAKTVKNHKNNVELNRVQSNHYRRGTELALGDFVKVHVNAARDLWTLHPYESYLYSLVPEVEPPWAPQMKPAADAADDWESHCLHAFLCATDSEFRDAARRAPLRTTIIGRALLASNSQPELEPDSDSDSDSGIGISDMRARIIETETMPLALERLQDAAAHSHMRPGMSNHWRLLFHLTPLSDFKSGDHIASVQKDLSLKGCTFVHKFAEKLGILKDLQALDLSASDACDDDLQFIALCRSLRTLDLTGTDVSAEGMRHLNCLPELETLVLGQTGVHDPAVRHLAGMSSLKSVVLPQHCFTELAALQLRKQLPGCNVQRI